MTELLHRAWRITIDRIVIDASQGRGLDCEFKIDKGWMWPTVFEPGKVSLKVHNLSEDHRKQLAQLSVTRRGFGGTTQRWTGPGAGRRDILVVIEAGYVGNMSVLFRGMVRYALSSKQGATWVTDIEGTDLGASRRPLDATIHRGYPAGTLVSRVIQDCAQAMGVGAGNLNEAIQAISGVTTTTPTALSGRARDELTGLLRRHGYTWTIHHGTLSVRERGRPLQGGAIRLAPGTGLVDSPVRNPDGTVVVKSLLIPDIVIGREVSVEGQIVRGTYWIRQLQYTGNTRSTDWYATLQCRDPGARRAGV